MVEEELIISKLKHDNIHVINSYKQSLSDYSSTITALRKQNLMSEEVAKSSLDFDRKLILVNKTLETKDDIASFQKLLLKLPTVIKNVDNTNARLKKYLNQKLESPYVKENKKQTTTPIHSVESIDEKQKKKRKKLLFTTLIIFVALGIGIASALIYDSINAEKSAYKLAVNNESIENYQNYLTQYPEGANTDIIDTKFQDFLLKNAIEENTSESINTLINYYPNHYALKNITINSSEVYYSNNLKGVNSSNVIIEKVEGKHLIPEGCRVHIVGESNDKRDVNKYFTVLEDKDIEFNFINEKEILIEDGFIDNRNKWKFAKDHNDMTVDIDNGFVLHHDNPSNLPFILMNTDLTKIDDYKIELEFTMHRNGNIYLLFAASENAFSFFGFDERNYKFWVGHNNYKDEDNRWKGWTNNSWSYDNSIKSSGKLSIIKKGITLQYFVGDVLVSETDYQKYYGDKIGVSINSEAYVKLNHLKIYKYTDEPKINFKRNKTYYCSASELNVREEPSLKAKEVNRISQGESVKYVGGKRNNVKAYYLKKPKYDYFYKVELTDGTIGWVHGGGLNEI